MWPTVANRLAFRRQQRSPIAVTKRDDSKRREQRNVSNVDGRDGKRASKKSGGRCEGACLSLLAVRRHLCTLRDRSSSPLVVAARLPSRRCARPTFVRRRRSMTAAAVVAQASSRRDTS